MDIKQQSEAAPCPACDGSGDASDKGRIEACCPCKGTGKAPSRDEALRAAFISGALAVHQQWVHAHERGDGPSRGDPEFGEAADDYVARAALEDRT